MLVRIAVASLAERKISVSLTLLSLVVSLCLLLTVELTRHHVKEGFTRSVSGVDMIIGARTSSLNLLLSSVFRLGTPTQGLTLGDLNPLLEHPMVDWFIPIALGDSHRGFRVVGTDERFFDYFRYGNKQALMMTGGDGFEGNFSAILGAEAAAALSYNVGDTLVLSHGLGEVSFHHHEQHPFIVSGILAPTGTPVDKAIYVTLEGLEQAHGPHASPREHEHEHEHEQSISAEKKSQYQISAVFVGLKQRALALQFQHQVNQYRAIALSAVLPGVALAELWQIMQTVERLLVGLSSATFFAALLGMTTMLLATLREREPELRVLRMIGARPRQIIALIQTEALLIVLSSMVLATLMVGITITVFGPTLGQAYGLYIPLSALVSSDILRIFVYVLAATWLISLVPAWKAYKNTG